MSWKVLLVHDDPALLELEKELQARIPCAIDRMESCSAATASLSSGRYDLIITGKWGTLDEKLSLVEAATADCATRVIVLGAEPNATEAVTAIRSGAFGYFSFPWSMLSLRELAVRAIEASPPLPPIGFLSALANWLVIQIHCESITIDRVIQLLREMNADLPVPFVDDITTAVREMILNAAEHGCGWDAVESIEVTFARTNRMLLYQIRDSGLGFATNDLLHAAVGNPSDNPLQHVEYRVNHNMRPGGFGMLLARKIVDEMLYNEKGNEVILIKYL
jgi:anti-sigma regulatory factor (Ser/Thr protein kinase)